MVCVCVCVGGGGGGEWNALPQVTVYPSLFQARKIFASVGALIHFWLGERSNMTAYALVLSLSVVIYNTYFPPENLLSCHTSVTPLRILLRYLVYLIVLCLQFFLYF